MKADPMKPMVVYEDLIFILALSATEASLEPPRGCGPQLFQTFGQGPNIVLNHRRRKLRVAGAGDDARQPVAKRNWQVSIRRDEIAGGFGAVLMGAADNS